VVLIIDPMMLPRGLPILVPVNLPHMAMPVNLPSFAGYPHEDPAFHVERFEEILISNLITRPEYYLIWFPNTLVEGAYAWYRSNATGSFQTWCQLQAAFLQQFRQVTGQQQALAALTDIRQGPSEDITSYVRRFRVVCTRYVGTLLNDETIRHYFIQGFDRHSTRKEVLSRRLVTTEDAINAALEVEVVNKEDDRMERRTNEPVPAFIPLTHSLMISQDTLTNPTLRVMVIFQVHQWYQQCHKDLLMREVGSTSKMKLSKQLTVSRRSLIGTYRV
jgi:hypothetical protein